MNYYNLSAEDEYEVAYFDKITVQGKIVCPACGVILEEGISLKSEEYDEKPQPVDCDACPASLSVSRMGNSYCVELA